MRVDWRRLGALVALVSFVLAIAGPLPLPAARHDGAAYPCQGHHCGCASAEHCRQHCCCFTAAQKLAWARRQGVDPAAVLTASELAAHRWAPPAAAPSTATAPATADEPACPACANAADAPAALASNGQQCGLPESKPAHQGRDGASASGTKWFSGVSALKCRGASTVWLVTGWVLPPCEPLAEGLAADERWAPLCCRCQRLTSAAQQPDAPPPRAA